MMAQNPSSPAVSRRTVLATSGAAGPAAVQTPTAEKALVTYPVPDGIAQIGSFEVRVRTGKGEWQRLGLYNTQVKMTNASGTADQTVTITVR